MVNVRVSKAVMLVVWLAPEREKVRLMDFDASSDFDHVIEFALLLRDELTTSVRDLVVVRDLVSVIVDEKLRVFSIVSDSVTSIDVEAVAVVDPDVDHDEDPSNEGDDDRLCDVVSVLLIHDEGLADDETVLVVDINGRDELSDCDLISDLLRVADKDGKEIVTSLEGAVLDREGLVREMVRVRVPSFDLVRGLVALRVLVKDTATVWVGPVIEGSIEIVGLGVSCDSDAVIERVVDCEKVPRVLDFDRLIEIVSDANVLEAPADSVRESVLVFSPVSERDRGAVACDADNVAVCD